MHELTEFRKSEINFHLTFLWNEIKTSHFFGAAHIYFFQISFSVERQISFKTVNNDKRTN